MLEHYAHQIDQACQAFYAEELKPIPNVVTLGRLKEEINRHVDSLITETRKARRDIAVAWEKTERRVEVGR